MFRLTRAVREYFRYSGVSADVERRGFGSSRPAFSWSNRTKGSSTAPSEEKTGLTAESESFQLRGGKVEVHREVTDKPGSQRG